VPTSPKQQWDPAPIRTRRSSLGFGYFHFERARRIHLHHGQGNERTSRLCECRCQQVRRCCLYLGAALRRQSGGRVRRSRRPRAGKVTRLAREAVAGRIDDSCRYTAVPGNRTGRRPGLVRCDMPSRRLAICRRSSRARSGARCPRTRFDSTDAGEMTTENPTTWPPSFIELG